MRFNAEAKARYLRFAQSPDAAWAGNFRDLGASVTRLATLAEGGRISEGLVEAEIERLRWLWRRNAAPAAAQPAELAAWLGEAAVEQLDLFDRLQLEAVIGVCRTSRSLSDAGRRLFNVSRMQRSVLNDADRLRKYLAKHGLNFEQLVTA